MKLLESTSVMQLPRFGAGRRGGSFFQLAGLGIVLLAVCWSVPRNAISAEPQGAARPAVQMTLDGRTFRVEAFESGKKVFDDRLMFKDGTFFSESCRKFGFSRSPYYVRMEGEEIQFLAETVSPTHGTMVWKGTVRKNRIDGGFRWTKERWYWTVLRDFDVKGIDGN